MTEVEHALRRAAAADLPAGAVERIVARALDEVPGIVAYATVDSPLGPLIVAATDRGVVRLAYPGEHDPVEDLARRLTPRVLEAPARLDEARRQLEEYFEGERDRFRLPLDLALVRGDFARRVLRAAARIPFGRTQSYTEVAAEAGSPRGSRAAGNALGANPVPIVVPCHRVLHRGGGLGGYTGGLERKVFLLRLEGVDAGGYPAGGASERQEE